jgi:hypothetical protein
MCKFGGSSSRGEFGRESERAASSPGMLVKVGMVTVGKVETCRAVKRQRIRAHWPTGSGVAQHNPPQTRPLARAQHGLSRAAGVVCPPGACDFTLDNPCYNPGFGRVWGWFHKNTRRKRPDLSGRGCQGKGKEASAIPHRAKARCPLAQFLWITVMLCIRLELDLTL